MMRSNLLTARKAASGASPGQRVELLLDLVQERGELLGNRHGRGLDLGDVPGPVPLGSERVVQVRGAYRSTDSQSNG